MEDFIKAFKTLTNSAIEELGHEAALKILQERLDYVKASIEDAGDEN